MGWDISASKFVRNLTALKASRVMKKYIFGPLGQKNLVYCIQTNRSFVERIPPEVIQAAVQAEFGQITPSQLAMAKNFDAKEVYCWIPEEYRRTIESMPGGPEWAMREMEILRPMIFG